MKKLFAMCMLTITAAACSSSGPKSTASSSSPQINTTTSVAGPATSVEGATTTSRPPRPNDLPKSSQEITAIGVELQTVAMDLESPVAAVSRFGDKLLYVAEQHTGRVVALDPASEPGPVQEVLDLRGKVAQGNEQGLLGLAFSIDGSKLFIHYNNPAGDSRIDEYTMAKEVADVSTRREIFALKQPFPNHNGGQLYVDANDFLYIGFGDGGLAGDPLNSGQDLNSLLGKILRIDPRQSGTSAYRVPADNPFVGRSGVRPEIWQWGLRNPWRFSFDMATNDLWIGDVGQNVYEEINHTADGVAGANFGWKLREGKHPFNDAAAPPDAVDPVFEYSHDDGGCSVTGGYVYRGASISALNGVYVFADYCAGDLIGISGERGATQPAHGPLGLKVAEPTSFAQDADGEIYVLSRDGSISKLVSK